MRDRTPIIERPVLNKIGQGLRSHFDAFVAPPMPPRMAAAFAKLTGIQPGPLDEGQGTPGNGLDDEARRELARRG
jgi:hypothetical protein